jgi:hypothetical protein
MQGTISGRAWDVVAGFELAYATTAGDQIRVPLVDAWSLGGMWQRGVIPKVGAAARIKP